MADEVKKTIGRGNREADTTRVDAVTAYEEAARAGTIEATSPRERALNVENQELRRQLAVMTSRVAVMSMGGKPGSTKPVGGLFERFKAFEEKTLSTIDMNNEAKLRALDEMAAALKSWNEREAKYLGEVERKVAAGETEDGTVTGHHIPEWSGR